jgi:hypothetical protein
MKAALSSYHHRQDDRGRRIRRVVGLPVGGVHLAAPIVGMTAPPPEVT